MSRPTYITREALGWKMLAPIDCIGVDRQNDICMDRVRHEEDLDTVLGGHEITVYRNQAHQNDNDVEDKRKQKNTRDTP